jgi:chaperonin GroEL (HSP60 family)
MPLVRLTNEAVSYTLPVTFVCRQLIYNYPEQLFADAGVMAIEHADFEGVERLALVTGKLLDEITYKNEK